MLVIENLVNILLNGYRSGPRFSRSRQRSRYYLENQLEDVLLKNMEWRFACLADERAQVLISWVEVRIGGLRSECRSLVRATREVKGLY